jgi:hypothetical protein
MMALEIIIRRRRTAKRLQEPDSRNTTESAEPKAKDTPPANDNEGEWPLIPFPDGSF